MNKLLNKLYAIRNSKKGFTLVELIVVILILAILIGVSVAGYSKYIGQSKVSTDKQNVETVRAAIVNAQAETGVYEELVANAGKTVTVTMNNEKTTVSGADLPTFTAAIKAQLGITGDESTSIRTQYTGGIVVVTATTPDPADGSATITIDASTSTTAYPANTF